MADVKLSIGEDQMKGLVAAAIADALTPEKKEELIRGAIRNLLETKSASYGNRSELQSAFDEAVRWQCRKAVESLIQDDPEITKQLSAMIAESAQRVFTTNREKCIEKMAASLEQGLRLRDY